MAPEIPLQTSVDRLGSRLMNRNRALRCALGSLLVAVLSVAGAAPARAQKGLGHLVETIAVDATDPDGVYSVNALVGGANYRLEVAGTITYGQGDSGADAECSQLKPDEGWQRNRYVAMTSYEDLLDLYLDNSPVNWTPTEPDALGCNSFNHTYYFEFVMPETRQIRLFLRDIEGSYHENSGAFVVKLSQITEATQETAPSAPPAKGTPSAAGAAPAPAPAGAALAPTSTRAPALASSLPPAPRPAPVPDGDEVEVAFGLVPVPVPSGPGSVPEPARQLASMVAVVAWTMVVTHLARRYRLVVVPRG